MRIPLSVIVIAKNEEARIEGALQSVGGWVDEIIVVDDESTDRTVDIAKKYTSHIFTRKMDLEGRQRNFGVDQSRNEWVMMLDCDERVPADLKNEIIETVRKNDPGANSYWMRQICFLGNVELQYGGWGSEHIRIYHKDRVRWKEDPYDLVHPGFIADKVKYQGYILQHRLLHYNFANIEDFIRKLNIHTTREAVKWHIGGKGAKMTLGRALWRTIDRFFRRYIGKKGYKDGYFGFIAAVLSGLYELVAYSKLREVREQGAYLKECGFNPDGTPMK